MQFRAEKDQLNRKIPDLSSKVSDAPVSKDELLSQMIQIGINNNLHEEMSKINRAIDILNYNHGVSVREHLGFGNAATKQLKFHTNKYGDKFIG